MASSLNQSRSWSCRNNSFSVRTVERKKVVSGVMPWQLEAEMDRRSNPQEPRNKHRHLSSSSSATSASQLQRRLIGGMNLSMSIPRSRPDRVANTINPSAIAFQRNGNWSCSICGFSNNIRESDSCAHCFQNALISSNNTTGRDRGGYGSSDNGSLVTRRVKPQQPTLTAEQWIELENKAAHRQDEGDSEPCPICLEDFKRGVPQLLLSCSHIFHTTCLKSFESFQGRDPTKEKPACPVCRAVDYEQRSTELGGIARANEMAVRIQSLARGVASRVRYAKIVRDWINGGGGDEKRRREYIATELSSLSSKYLVGQVEDDSLDALLSASDDAIALSQSVFSEEMHSHGSITPFFSGVISESSWYGVLVKARTRCDTECAICMNTLVSSQEIERSRKISKTRIILSCSHVFHNTCLSAFERFNLTSVSNSTNVCPMCRAAYEKRKLSKYGFAFCDSLEEEE